MLDFKTGSRLRLEIFGDSGQSIERVFISQLEEAINEYEAYIAAPIVEGVVYAVRNGWNTTVYTQEGNDFYRFHARVMQRLQRDGLALLRIQRVSDIETTQRRRYYRFKCAIPFKYRIIANIDADMGAPFINGQTADISGAGLSFASADVLEVDSLIECELTIDSKQIYLVGKIKRCYRVQETDSESFKYNVGVFFSEIENAHREMIIRYIFNEERRQIRVGIA